MSNSYLIAFSIGPVQTFIEAARRTRDLWAASSLLSDLARTVGQDLSSRFQAEIIFPQQAAVAGKQSAGLGNKVIAIALLDNPAEQLQTTANKLKLQISEEGKQTLVALEEQKLHTAVDEARFKAQLTDALDIAFAWVPLPSKAQQVGDYAKAFTRLQAILDARKQTRAFVQVDQVSQGNKTLAHGLTTQGRKARASAPTLSSLDALRENVLIDDGTGTLQELQRRYQINCTEALDAMGLIKRVSARQTGFPAVTRIALQPYVAGLTEAQQKAIATHLEALTPQHIGLVRRYQAPEQFKRIDQGVFTAVPNPLHTFAFDGQALLANRRQVLQASFPEFEAELKALGNALAEIPAPPDEGLYVCVLVADGDRMGEILQAPGITKAQHQCISAALAQFANNCAAICAQHGAASVYAGGDDLLAICPVDTALPLARNLADRFACEITPVLPDPKGPKPSLSVGLAFAHVMQPLGEMRRLAAQACHLAKQGLDGQGLRNALAVIVSPRGGSPVMLAAPWDETLVPSTDAPGATGLDGRLCLWRDAFAQGALSRNAAYDLRQLGRSSGSLSLRAEVGRLFDRRFTAQNLQHGPALAAGVLARAHTASDTAAAYQALSNEWYVGRWLAQHGVAPPPGPPVQTVPPAPPAIESTPE